MKSPFGPPPDGLHQRLPDWHERLLDLVNSRGSDPYEYGVHDCATFAQAAVHAVTGVTLLPGVNLPKGWIGAAKFLLQHDLADVKELATAALGFPPNDHPELSKPGDLAVFKLGKEYHLAVRIGDGAITPTDSGLASVDWLAWPPQKPRPHPLARLESFWAIGRDPSTEPVIA